ncbi:MULTISPECIES: ParM/StbA family protein [unclassified Microcoleus]|uniref:ParM/StbA family protein n=1 Tax=unclassified Microcoleus TaxID=2642155 RepID=UPI002FD1B38D
MTITYSHATYGAIQPHRAVVRPVLAVDPGNRFTKWIDCQTVRSIPSYVKELADWEEGGADGQSYEIEFDGRRYLVGRLAQLMGGSPAFESGKADLAHLLILPALASDSPQRIEKLVIPTPDSRNQQTIAKLKELETTIEFSVNGRECLTTIRSVSAVDECRGAYDLALGRQMWRYPNNPNGILDIGGGTAIARLFAPGGALLRDADIVLPGTSHLAQRLAAAILPKVGTTADAGSLMDSIAANNFIYGNTDIDFSREFVAVRDAWTADIRAKLKTNWAKYLPSLGELVVIGGSASLLQPMCEQSKGRFKVAPRPQFFNLYGLNKETN